MRLVAIAISLVAIATIGCTPSPESESDMGLVSKVPQGFIVKAATASSLSPSDANQYRRTLIAAAHQVWGLDAPLATFASQVHQESGWRTDVVSSAGAQGLAQFMPSTANWIDDIYPEELGPAQPFDPSWALKALVRYDRHLWDRIEALGECERIAFTLSAYNGGLGWVYRDQGVAKDHGLEHRRYWGVVEQFNAGRNASAWKENRGYPERIVKVLQPRYATWGRMVCAA